MGKLPGFVFYPGDWLKDPELRRCSREARSIWIDMICLMFECEERGVLSTGGRVWTLREIAGALSGDERTNLRRVGELLRNGVAKRRKDGAVFSKRLVRDDQERQQTKNRVASFRGKKASNGACNASVTPKYEDEDVTVKPLAVAFEVEAFDAEKYVRRVQEVWPKKDYSPICENEILRAFEFEAEQRKCSREDAAKYVTERLERIGGLVSGWPKEKKPMIPKLLNVVHSRGYRNADETWTQAGQVVEAAPLKWKAKA